MSVRKHFGNDQLRCEIRLNAPVSNSACGSKTSFGTKLIATLKLISRVASASTPSNRRMQRTRSRAFADRSAKCFVSTSPCSTRTCDLAARRALSSARFIWSGRALPDPGDCAASLILESGDWPPAGLANRHRLRLGAGQLSRGLAGVCHECRRLMIGAAHSLN